MTFIELQRADGTFVILNADRIVEIATLEMADPLRGGRMVASLVLVEGSGPTFYRPSPAAIARAAQRALDEGCLQTIPAVAWNKQEQDELEKHQHEE